MSLKPIIITARDIPDAWHQCVFEVLRTEFSRARRVDKGSYEGEYRLEFDFPVIHIIHPGSRPLIPEIPAYLGIPNPVESMEYVEKYFARYLMSDVKEGDEQYTYGERIVAAPTSVISHIDKKQTYFSDDIPITVNQIDEIIARYREFGPGNNQLPIRVAQPADIMLRDPPCLQFIDTRIEEGKLHFNPIYFRSWDLWGGFPANLAAIQLMKEYMADAIGVEDGEMICISKGLHLYGYVWEIAGKRRGLTEEEMKAFLELKGK
jgi:thymidylate synthase